jgi:hypothetical protein
MKIILQNEQHSQVVTVRDGDIDLEHYDRIWDIYTRVDFAGIQVDVCITGNKTDGECPGIDYTVPVEVETYCKEDDTCYFKCRSPIIKDEYTRELLGPMTPDELIRRMARIAVPMMPDTHFLRDFSYHDAGFVRRTDAARPFLWLVRERGTFVCDLTKREDVPGFLISMEHYRDSCCMFHYDGCGRKWSDDYVLVQFPEDSSYFENEEIGYPCFNSEDNGARYVPEYDYIRHFQKDPMPESLYKPLCWPESQQYLSHPDSRCEAIIADEKALADFGPAAVWVPMCLLDSKVN